MLTSARRPTRGKRKLTDATRCSRAGSETIRAGACLTEVMNTMSLRTTLLLAGALVFLCTLAAPARGEEDVRAKSSSNSGPALLRRQKPPWQKPAAAAGCAPSTGTTSGCSPCPPEQRCRRFWHCLPGIRPSFMPSPITRVRAFSTPDDESYPLQWNFQLINMEAAWDMSTGDGRNGGGA